MDGKLTFAMIKPDAVRNNQIGAIIQAIERASFEIKAMGVKTLDQISAASFYKVHEHRPFYSELCTFISSGPVVVMALKKEHAVSKFRNLIGATDPAGSEEGTIRKKFGTSLGCNAIHGSDSEENALLELSFFFTGQELL